MPTDKVTTKSERRRISGYAEVPFRNNNPDALKGHLNSWLGDRTIWNHEEWLTLLADLREKGYSDLIDTPKGQEVIGRYLEMNKKCSEC